MGAVATAEVWAAAAETGWAAGWEAAEGRETEG